MKKTLLLFFLLTMMMTMSFSLFALEDDRRLIVRVLGVSATKKTILINRGREEGVKIGDHAKFSTPRDGYFARGVVSRVSPTRSVWSIYRTLKEGIIIENAVVTLKAASQVKLTKDESKALGILANSYKRAAKEDPLAKDVIVKTQAQKELEIKMAKVQTSRNFKHRKGVSYKSLNETIGSGKNKAIDWRGLDGDLDDLDGHKSVDFKNLRERNRDW